MSIGDRQAASCVLIPRPRHTHVAPVAFTSGIRVCVATGRDPPGDTRRSHPRYPRSPVSRPLGSLGKRPRTATWPASAPTRTAGESHNPPVAVCLKTSGQLSEPEPTFRLAIGSRTPPHNPGKSLPRHWRTRGKPTRTSGTSQCLYFGNGGTRARQAADRNSLRELALKQKKPWLCRLGFFVNPWVRRKF
jgi:hypothetical protein